MTPEGLLSFWFSERARKHWFRSTPAFDKAVREGYERTWLKAREGGLSDWAQTAEGALQEVSNILSRMRELAMQSANGTLGAGERGALNTEFQDLLGEIDRIAAVTQFNGTALLDGTAPTVTFQVGVNNAANDQISVTGVVEASRQRVARASTQV